jgi:hypothetical protein
MKNAWTFEKINEVESVYESELAPDRVPLWAFIKTYLRYLVFFNYGITSPPAPWIQSKIVASR